MTLTGKYDEQRDLTPRQADWLVEWTLLYNRLDGAQRWQMYRLLRARLWQERWQRARWGLQSRVGRWVMRWQERFYREGGILEQIESIPAGALRLPLLQTGLTFVILGLLPRHAMSIPLALGLSAVALVYVQIIAYAMGYRLRG